MKIDEQMIRDMVSNILSNQMKTHNPIKDENEIPVEVSARHVHLSEEDVEYLFGPNYKLKPKKYISQPGQYLCEERVKLVTGKSEVANVAVLGPTRERTQVEISVTDARMLGIDPPLRMSGDLSGAEDIFIVAGKKMINSKNSVIIARNHIHMLEEEAARLGVSDKQCVQVQINSERPLIFDNVMIRTNENSKLAMHIDFDEANACKITKDTKVKIKTHI